MNKLWMVFLAGLLLCSPLFVLGATLTEDFVGITSPSSTHKAYVWKAHYTASDWGNISCQFTTSQYTNVSVIDDGSKFVYGNSDAYSRIYTEYRYNVSKILLDNSIDLSSVSSIKLTFNGYAYASSSGDKGVYSACYNSSSLSWITSDSGSVTGTWSHTNTSDDNLIITITDDFDDFLDSGIFKYSVRSCYTNFPDYGLAIFVDYVKIDITYNPLSTPSFTAPASGSTSSSSSPTVSWGAVSGATGYNLEIGNSDFSVLEVSEANVTSTSKVCSLTNGIKYARVRACDGTNYSYFSDTLVFTVNSVAGGGTGGGTGTYLLDRDGDSVFDYLDKCPDVRGDPSNDGCPVADKPSDGPRENLLTRSILKVYGFPVPFWSLIVVLAGIGYVKRRPELYIISGLIVVALILFGTKLSVVFV